MTRALAIVPLLVVLGACSVGSGIGVVTGEVFDRRCELENTAFALEPSFFSADFIEDIDDPDGSRRLVSMRIQRGSYRAGDSDGISLLISDVNAIERELVAQAEAGVAEPSLELPIGRGPDAPVQMIFYLAETCVSGPPNGYRNVPFALEALSGRIIFRDVYAPDIESQDTRFAFSFSDVAFAADSDPEGRRARLEGDIDFLYQRGRPAQSFP